MDPNRRRATMLSLRETVTQWNLREAYKARGCASRVSEIYLNRDGNKHTAIAQCRLFREIHF